MKIRLTIDVEYVRGSISISEVRSQLSFAACFLSDKGMLSGEGPAEVEKWSHNVETLEYIESEEEA